MRTSNNRLRQTHENSSESFVCFLFYTCIINYTSPTHPATTSNAGTSRFKSQYRPRTAMSMSHHSVHTSTYHKPQIASCSAAQMHKHCRRRRRPGVLRSCSLTGPTKGHCWERDDLRQLINIAERARKVRSAVPEPSELEPPLSVDRTCAVG